MKLCSNCKYYSSHRSDVPPCNNCYDFELWERDVERFTSVEDDFPPLGVPLMVNTSQGELKYPVYYAKDPYSGCYKWYFFPAMECLCVLLPEYSDVKEWKEIFD